MEKRQEKILKYITEEYIRTAEPVSSKKLAEKYRIDLAPASIRWEMVRLEKEEYLLQPYISSGRVPTEKAYRFFIDKFCQPRLSKKTERDIEKIFTKKNKEEEIKEIGKLVALISKSISICFFESKISWQGLSYFLSQPEFLGGIDEILQAIEGFEKLRDNLDINFLDCSLNEERVKVYIGRENPFGRDKNLSLILGGIEDGLIGILGLIRMDYSKNIGLIKKTRELMEENF